MGLGPPFAEHLRDGPSLLRRAILIPPKESRWLIAVCHRCDLRHSQKLHFLATVVYYLLLRTMLIIGSNHLMSQTG